MDASPTTSARIPARFIWAATPRAYSATVSFTVRRRTWRRPDEAEHGAGVMGRAGVQDEEDSKQEERKSEEEEEEEEDCGRRGRGSKG